MALHIAPDVLHDGRVVPDRPVGVDVEDVEVTPRPVLHDHVGILRERNHRIAADGDRQFRVSRLVPEVGRFQRRCIIPRGLRRKTDVLLVPELPVGHGSPERSGDLLRIAVDGDKIARQVRRIRFGPPRRVVVHAGGPDAALRQQLRVEAVLLPVVFPGFRLAVGPAHALADNLDAAAPDQLRKQFIGVARINRIRRIGTSEPALAGIDRKKRIGVAEARGRVRHDRKAADSGKRRLRRLHSQLVIAVRQRRQPQLLPAGAGPLAGTQHLAIPAQQLPAERQRRIRFQAERQRLALDKDRTRRMNGDRRSGVETSLRGLRTQHFEIADIERRLLRTRIGADPDRLHGGGIGRRLRNPDRDGLPLRLQLRQRDVRRLAVIHQISVPVALAARRLHGLDVETDGLDIGQGLIRTETDAGIAPEIGSRLEFDIEPDRLLRRIIADRQAPRTVMVEPRSGIQPLRPRQRTQFGGGTRRRQTCDRQQTRQKFHLCPPLIW